MVGSRIRTAFVLSFTLAAVSVGAQQQGDRPVASQRAASSQQSAATPPQGQPAGTAQQPTGTAQQPTGTAQQPTGTAQQPTGTAQQPTGTAQQPTGTAEQPAGTAPVNPSQQPPTFRGGINYVRVDATVTDRKGQPVYDLKQSDFEVIEDGKPQTVDSFRLIRVDGNPKPGDGPPRAIRSRDDEEAEAARDD